MIACFNSLQISDGGGWAWRCPLMAFPPGSPSPPAQFPYGWCRWAFGTVPTPASRMQAQMLLSRISHLLSPVSPGWCFRGEQLGFQMQAAPWDWTHDHCPQYIPLYLIYLPYGSLVPVATMEEAKGCSQEPMCAHTTSTHLLHTHTHHHAAYSPLPPPICP